MRTPKLIPDSLKKKKKKKKKKKARIGLLAVLYFRLFSSCAFPKTLQIYFHRNFLKCFFGFKLIAPSTSSNL